MQRKQGNTAQSPLASQKTSNPLNEEDLKKRDQEQGMPHCLEDALTPQNLEALEKALEEQITRDVKEEQKTPEQREREQRLRNTSYADLEHSNPEEREQKLKLLEKTDKMMQAVHQEYGEVMQELEERVFSKIISKRQLRTRENR